MNCPKCNAQNREKSKFCSKCGIPFTQQEKSNVEEKILGNRYRIEKLIKSGGMGSVYRARHIKLDSIYAIKEMIFTSTDVKQNQYGMKRFYEEAKILSRLRHPNLPVVTDYFDEHNKYYIVMDFVEGEDLESILKKYGNPGLPEKHVRYWSEEVLKVLSYLHNQSPPIIYRDIKPSNIMIRNSDKKVMLVDFGIARTIQGNVYSGQTAIGTFGYAPLEQYRGQVEPRSDLYALGATMHCLLTGIEPVSCDFKPVREILPSISESLEKIIQKALQEKLENRFSSAEVMVKEIRDTTPAQVLASQEKTTSYAYKDLPSDKVSTRQKIKCDLNTRKPFKEIITDPIKINEIKVLINNWGNKGSWFARDFGNKIDIIQTIRENAFIVSVEVLYMERTLEEGVEPCSEEQLKNLVFMKPSYNSLEDFPIITPPEGFTTKLEENYIFPDSRQIAKCSRCGGDGDITCKECRGKGVSTKTKKITPPVQPEVTKCKYCRGTGKATCDLCNGYKEIIKYLFFGTKYYPMYFSDIIYSGRLDKNLFQSSEKFLIYEEEIFDRKGGKVFDNNKIQPVQNSLLFKDPFNLLMEEISSHYKDTKTELKVPLRMKLSIEEIIIKEIQFKDKKKPNSIWIYGIETDEDKLTIENRPLLWVTEDIIDGVRSILSGKRI